MWTSVLITVGAILCLETLAEASCGTCNANAAACVSKNEFQMCFGNVPNSNQTFKCPKATQVCTKFGMICMDTAQAPYVKPACGDTSKCGSCSGVQDGGFTCTSRHTFTMCADEKLSEQRSHCPEGYLCDPRNNAAPCVERCAVDEAALCDLDTPIDEPVSLPQSTITTASATVSDYTEESTLPTTPPTTPPTTSSVTPTTVTPTQKPPQNACYSSGRFPYGDETDCSGYVRCFWKSGTLHSTILPCPGGRYFNKNSATCETVKPSWCQ